MTITGTPVAGCPFSSLMTGQNVIDMAFNPSGSLARSDLQPYMANKLENVTAAQQVVALNWALKTIGRKIKMYNPSVTFTVSSGVATYDLRNTTVFSRRIVRPYCVIINGEELLDNGGRRGLWTMHELRRDWPRWRTDPVASTRRAVNYDHFLLLHPTPNDANVSGGNNFVEGTVLPRVVTNDADPVTGLTVELDIVEDIQEMLAFFMAQYCAEPTVDEDNAWKRLAMYRQEWMDVVDDISHRNGNLLAPWGSGPMNESDDYLFR